MTDVELELSAFAGGRLQPLPVDRVGPGLFEATLAQVTYGRDEWFVWRIGSQNSETRTVPYGFVYSFSPEFRTLGANEETFEQIAARAAGELMSVGESHLVTDEARSVVTVRLWPYLLLAAVLLAPLDILCRRLG